VSYCGLTFAACSNQNLYVDSNTYVYTNRTQQNTKTIFVRTISLSPSAGNTNEQALTVTVQWKDVGGVARYVILRENLLNWQ
jgi:hypothetical protein